jgi:hypothetical protein
VKVSELNFFPSFNYYVSGIDHYNVTVHDLPRGIGLISRRLVGFLGEEWGESKRQSNQKHPLTTVLSTILPRTKRKISLLA